jgi:hypothetical protein
MLWHSSHVYWALSLTWYNQWVAPFAVHPAAICTQSAQHNTGFKRQAGFRLCESAAVEIMQFATLPNRFELVGVFLSMFELPTACRLSAYSADWRVLLRLVDITTSGHHEPSLRRQPARRSAVDRYVVLLGMCACSLHIFCNLLCMSSNIPCMRL